MEETRPMHKMIPEEEFAAFLEVHPPKMLLSQVGYAYCAEGTHVAEREARLKRLEDAARQKHATQKELESWQGQREFFDFNWDSTPTRCATSQGARRWQAARCKPSPTWSRAWPSISASRTCRAG